MWDKYINELSNCKFCLSLPGKGMDCYRTWEALTLGVIPIVIRTKHMNSIYDNLPVIIIDDINEITHEFLNEQFEIVKKQINQSPILEFDNSHLSSQLDGIFGDRWEEPFKIWFEDNFHFPVKTILK